MLVYCIRVIVAVGRSPDVACCVGRVTRVVVWWAARRPGVVALLRESFLRRSQRIGLLYVILACRDTA